jgi:hypothetical protein
VTFFYRLFVIIATLIVAGEGAPGGRFDLKINCAAPPSDLSDLLSDAYRDIAKPDSYNHVNKSR